MDMHMRDYLICGYPVVLAYVKAIRFCGRDYPLCNSWHQTVKPANFCWRHPEEVFIVLGGDYQSMANVDRILVHDNKEIGISVDLRTWLLA